MAMLKLLAALGMATVVVGAQASPGLSREGFSALMRAQASQPAPAFPFQLADVQAVRLTVTARDASGDGGEDEYLLWRDDSGLVSRRGPVDASLANAFGQLAAATPPGVAGQPALGLHSCGEDATDTASGSLQVQLTVLLRDRKPLQLRSHARCENMLPWNSYDGEHLSVHSARPAGQALIALTQAMCGQCLQSLWPASQFTLRAARNGGGFDEHYTALRANMQDPGAPALLQALDWMDHARLVATLDREGARPLATSLLAQRWGYVDRKGAFKLARRFEKAEAFAGDLAAVRLDGIWQGVDRHGQLRAATAASIYRAPDNKGDPALRCDFPDASGRSVIAASFDELGPFRGELAAARRGGEWGFVNAKGRWVIPARYEQVLAFSEGLAAVRLKGRWGYVDTRGRFTITPRFVEAGSFSGGLAAVR
jgi:hypothetical protein